MLLSGAVLTRLVAFSECSVSGDKMSPCSRSSGAGRDAKPGLY